MSALGLGFAFAASIAIAAIARAFGQREMRRVVYWVGALTLAGLPVLICVLSPFLGTFMPAIAPPLEPVANLIAPRSAPGMVPRLWFLYFFL